MAQVLLDGRPVRAYEHDWYHRHVSIVAQEPTLYGRSIRRNIIFGLEVRVPCLCYYRCTNETSTPGVRVYVCASIKSCHP